MDAEELRARSDAAFEREVTAVCNFVGPERAQALREELLQIKASSEAHQKRLEDRVQELLAEMRAEREQKEAEDRAFRKELKRDALTILAGIIVLIIVAIIAQ